MVDSSRNKSFNIRRLRWTRAAFLMLTLSLASVGCQPPKVFAVSAPGNITPREEAPAPDTVVVPLHKKEKKSALGEILLIYALALLVAAIILVKTKLDEPT